MSKVALDLTARTVVAFFRSLDKNLNPSSTEKARGKGLKLKQVGCRSVVTLFVVSNLVA